MKAALKKILVIFSLLIGVHAFSQSDYSTIHFLPVKTDKGYEKFFANLNFKLYINDKLVTSVGLDEQLAIKTYSQGRLTLTVITNNERGSITLDVNSASDYYVVKSMSAASQKKIFFKAVDSAEWKTFVPFIKNTVNVDEDKENPYGKIDNSKKSGKGQGTCFALSNGYVITNYHVIENAKEITVKGIDGDYTTKYGATVVASDKTNDLALLKMGNKNVKFENIPYALRASGVQQGEKVYAMGFPMAVAMGQEVKLTDGIISSKSGIEGDISKYQVSAAVNPGNSGGPLIDEQGNVIGVIYAKSTIAESTSYAIKAGYVETFLKNIDGFEFPNMINTVKDKSFPDKVAELKKYIFIVETN